MFKLVVGNIAELFKFFFLFDHFDLASNEVRVIYFNVAAGRDKILRFKPEES